jgi:hypothetical protein
MNTEKRTLSKSQHVGSILLVNESMQWLWHNCKQSGGLELPKRINLVSKCV